MTQEREIDSGEGGRVETHTFGLGRGRGGEEIATVRGGVVQVPATRSTVLPVTYSAAHNRRGLLGLLRWVSGGGRPRPLCPSPHLSFYIALCDRGPQTSGRLSIADQDAVKGSDWPLGQLVEIKLTVFSYIKDSDVLYVLPLS